MAELMYDEDIIDGFKQECKLRSLTPGTIRSYRSVLRQLMSFLSRQGKGLREVDEDTLKQYLAHMKDRDLKGKTIDNHFSALSTFFDYLVYEGAVERNYALAVRKRYNRRYKNDNRSESRKLISVEEMSMFANSIMSVRDRAFVVLLAKTGIRRGELVAIDIDDVDFVNLTLRLKPTPKRSNLTVYFDYETKNLLEKWLRQRQEIANNTNALFVGYNTGERLKRSGIYNAFLKWAKKVGLHDPESKKTKDHFTPHCCRHWFTTHLRRAGMKREYIKELRGDKRTEAIDIYHHIDKEALKREYLACIPQLGVA